MKLPCDIKAPCLDDANPFINLSSEAPDVNHFYAYGSGPGSHSGGRTTGPGGVGPRPGGNWSDSCDTPDGPATCAATTQAEADLCVARLAQQCTPPPGTPPGAPTTPSGDRLFANRLQQCSALCPDGTPFIYTVPAGLFVATSQIVADREAHSYACRQASLARICFGALSNNSACVGQSFSSTITVSGGSGFTFTITNGSLPPGVTLSSSGGTALFSGTPTTAGVYSFTLTATNSRGNSISKTLTIGVMTFTNGAPPPYTVGTPYTFQFTAAGGNAPYVFTVASGALPPGLTLSTTGLISGTATAAETDVVTVKVTDAASRSCNKGYLITPSAAKKGWQICHWADQVRPFFLDFTGCAASALPAWDGVFDKVSTAGATLNPFWYFVSQSVNGIAVAADADPAYLATPTWPDSVCCFQLYFFGGQWNMYLSCADCSLPWPAPLWDGQGTSVDPNDPSGVYTQTFGSALGPATITIKASPAVCCPDAGTPVPAVFNVASPARVQIHDLAGFVAALGACPGCSASAAPAWDGKLPVKCTSAPDQLTYSLPGLTCVVFGTTLPAVSLSGLQIQTGIAGDDHSRIGVQFIPSARWEFAVQCKVSLGQSDVWIGEKLVGDTPQGTYIRKAGAAGGIASGPGCVTIEAY